MRQKPLVIFAFLAVVFAVVAYFLWGDIVAPSGVISTQKTHLVVAVNAGDEGRAIVALGRKYEKAEIEFVELPYTNLREKLVSTLSATNPVYDVVMLDDPWFPELAPHLAEIRQVSDELLQDIIPSTLRLGRDPYPSGTLKALPFVGNCQLLFIRSDILTGANLSEPAKTLEELGAQLGAIRGSNGALSGYIIRGRSGAPVVSDFLPILWSFGGNVFANNEAPSFSNIVINTPATHKALEFYKRLADNSPQGALNYDWNEMTAAFIEGRAAYQLNWPAAVKTVNDGIRAKQPKADLNAIWKMVLPLGAENNPGTSMMGNWLLAVPKTSLKQEEGMKFIAWLLQNQHEAALDGNPPTRRSVYDSIRQSGRVELQYYNVVREALEQATPRPRTPQWAQIEDIMSRYVTAYLAGTMTTKDTVIAMERDIRAIMVQ